MTYEQLLIYISLRIDFTCISAIITLIKCRKIENRNFEFQKVKISRTDWYEPINLQMRHRVIWAIPKN